jgi:hypothetical protein
MHDEFLPRSETIYTLPIFKQFAHKHTITGYNLKNFHSIVKRGIRKKKKKFRTLIAVLT